MTNAHLHSSLMSATSLKINDHWKAHGDGSKTHIQTRSIWCLLSPSQFLVQILLVNAYELSRRLHIVYIMMGETQGVSELNIYMFCWRTELVTQIESKIINHKIARGQRCVSLAQRWGDSRLRSPIWAPGLLSVLPGCSFCHYVSAFFLSSSLTLWKECWPWWAMRLRHQ